MYIYQGDKRPGPSAPVLGGRNEEPVYVQRGSGFGVFLDGKGVLLAGLGAYVHAYIYIYIYTYI
jgi:hypothetical protein